MSKYNYTELYNEHWQHLINKLDFDTVGILRFDKDGNKIWGFRNEFEDSQSPYDFFARIGEAVLEELSREEIGYLQIDRGSYILANAHKR